MEREGKCEYRDKSEGDKEDIGCPDTVCEPTSKRACKRGQDDKDRSAIARIYFIQVELAGEQSHGIQPTLTRPGRHSCPLQQRSG